uniref:Lipoprotein n=1 Tax=Stenotrophomonas maltophilia TaxID=40324 RepID=Q7WZL8_STEMA|nr:hypothetical protein [Stenotrophomonas maltophilia]
MRILDNRRRLGWQRIGVMAGALFMASAISGCDKPQPVFKLDLEALQTKCYAGSVHHCDTYENATGTDLPYAENVRKAHSKPKTKGAEF